MAKSKANSLKDTAGSTERWTGPEMSAIRKKIPGSDSSRLWVSIDKDKFKAKGYNQPETPKRRIKRETLEQWHNEKANSRFSAKNTTSNNTGTKNKLINKKTSRDQLVEAFNKKNKK